MAKKKVALRVASNPPAKSRTKVTIDQYEPKFTISVTQTPKEQQICVDEREARYDINLRLEGLNSDTWEIRDVKLCFDPSHLGDRMTLETPGKKTYSNQDVPFCVDVQQKDVTNQTFPPVKLILRTGYFAIAIPFQNAGEPLPPINNNTGPATPATYTVPMWVQYDISAKVPNRIDDQKGPTDANTFTITVVPD